MLVRISVIAFVFLAALLAFQNCEELPATEEFLDQTENLSATEKLSLFSVMIEDVVGLECTQDSDCKTAPMGAKLCGGPASHLLYSNVGESEEELLQLVAEYNEAAIAAVQNQAEEGMVGNCMYEMPPQDLRCVNNSCSSESRNLWSSQVEAATDR